MKKVFLAITTVSIMFVSSVAICSESQHNYTEESRQRHGLDKSVKILDLGFFTGQPHMKFMPEPTVYENRQARLKKLDERKRM